MGYRRALEIFKERCFEPIFQIASLLMARKTGSPEGSELIFYVAGLLEKMQLHLISRELEEIAGEVS
jgi:hypothetical protein